MDEDSGAILRQISSFKNMIDQVNEEIEANIQTTRHIESEIIRCSELEKGYLIRESKLSEMVFNDEFELNGVLVATTVARNSLESTEEELNAMNSYIENMLRRIQEKREKFITQCEQFQEDIVSAETEELHELLSKKDALDNERQSLISKIDVLKHSTADFIEEALGEIISLTTDIDDLKNLICNLI
ncbi:unnamed protein product [Spirodela intermedia]|uniref:Uncharacterized protein n=1 Tax=Spirodela intermedia TaxID=51605 RepID=A0A7I8KDW5_SPIIN|nr:unnamed protein product [Spirodela intermedia]